MAFISVLSVLPASSVSAAVSGWNPAYIMDDGIMTNKNTMTAGQIEEFLISKVPTCDTNGTQPSEYGGGTRAQWGQATHGQSTFYCLRDFWEGGRNGAQIIYDTAQKYSINPQVLLVLLQKEQGLVTDTWPLNLQYRTATGYGCPDSAPCDSQYYGLTNQLDWSAKMFRAILNQSSTWYSPYTVGNNFIRWSPDSSCGGTTVNIANLTTAALYDYTPYQPNQAALNAGLGTGDGCSAYGNRNFYIYFTSWFGDTRIQVIDPFISRYTTLGGTGSILGKATINKVCGLKDNGCYQGFDTGGLYWSQNSSTYESYGPIRLRYSEMGNENSSLGYPNNPVICGLKDNGCYQGYQNGTLYYSPNVGHAYENMGTIRDRFMALGTEGGVLGYPSSPMVCGLRSGGCFQGFENGAIYKSPLGTFENYGSIRQYYLLVGTENGFLGYPTSTEQCNTKYSGCYQSFEGGMLYQSTTTGAHSVRGGMLAKWSQYGKEWGALGMPTSDEIYGGAGGSSHQNFEGGTIYWTSAGGRAVLSSINTRWQEIGAETGKLGFPTGDTMCGTKDGGCYQLFPNTNTIYWSQATGAKTVWGGIYAAWNSAGKEWGRLGYPTTNEYAASNGDTEQDFQGGSIFWNTTSGVRVVYN
ncbi:MAG: hypothetical protein JWO07_145 [Candidatus Saccharibacteria bacterium]|nr:hypothetical protein [Candidatus Saccharibacteria bacterium]